VVGEPGSAELDELDRGRGRAGRPEHDERLADLAEPSVGHADHRGLGNGRVPGQRLLDLGRVHVDPAADVHVLEPVGDRQVAAFVEAADVAGVQPAVGVDRLGRRGRVVQVAEHHVRPAEQDLVGIAARGGDRDLEVGGCAA